MPSPMSILPFLWMSKVTHVATRHAPCEGTGKPFPLDPKPGAERHGWLE